MKKHRVKKLAVMLLSGSMLLQVPACAETAVVLTSVFTGLTTTGVFYIVSRIFND